MFEKQTVFILGAGASWHYGYPTGEDLVDEIAKQANRLAEYFNRLRSRSVSFVELPKVIQQKIQPPITQAQITTACSQAYDEYLDFAKRLLQVNPLVIDYFLGKNPEFQEIGKILIAWVLLERECRYKEKKGNINRIILLENSPNPEDREKAGKLNVSKYKDRWCRFIVEKLVNDCKKPSDLLKNNVDFITFNYDVSLEREIYASLSSINFFKGEVDEFFNSDRFFHVYGQLDSSPPFDFTELKIGTYGSGLFGYGSSDSDIANILNEVCEISDKIKIIEPDNKEEDKKNLKKIQDKIKNAECVYILGFGFDKNNSKRLNLRDSLESNRRIEPYRKVLFTNYLDTNQVNKKVSKILLPSGYVGFFTKNSIYQEYPPHYYEKSIRSVYDALAMDFDAIEEN